MGQQRFIKTQALGIGVDCRVTSMGGLYSCGWPRILSYLGLRMRKHYVLSAVGLAFPLRQLWIDYTWLSLYRTGMHACMSTLVYHYAMFNLHRITHIELGNLTSQNSTQTASWVTVLFFWFITWSHCRLSHRQDKK